MQRAKTLLKHIGRVIRDTRDDYTPEDIMDALELLETKYPTYYDSATKRAVEAIGHAAYGPNLRKLAYRNKAA